MSRLSRTATRTMVIAAAAALAGGLTAIPAQAASSGGGCTNRSAGGTTISACISYSADFVRPDYYVDVRGADCKGVTWYMIDNGSVRQQGIGTCSRGHWGPYPWFVATITGSHYYYMKIVANTGPTVYSPNLYVSP
ncbi:hypothetical protein [Actinoplanes sp. NPDC049599]|uniref:hypothetical protein n=1 Tax=Actinoplanes sp. NPDC049599 TaxID=3363903 RepID=UPI0037B0A200